MSTLRIRALPFALTVDDGQPEAVVLADEADAVVLTASPGDDLFADPAGVSLVATARRFTASVAGDFRFQANVAAEFLTQFDSGVLLGYYSDTQWFKICAELDTAGTPRVVTVVTNGRSDDANHTALASSDVMLRVSRSGKAFSLHASNDGIVWDLMRYFSLDIPGDAAIDVGIAAQSPAGQGTNVRFSRFAFANQGLVDPRDGT